MDISLKVLMFILKSCFPLILLIFPFSAWPSPAHVVLNHEGLSLYLPLLPVTYETHCWFLPYPWGHPSPCAASTEHTGCPYPLP